MMEVKRTLKYKDLDSAFDDIKIYLKIADEIRIRKYSEVEVDFVIFAEQEVSCEDCLFRIKIGDEWCCGIEKEPVPCPSGPTPCRFFVHKDLEIEVARMVLRKLDEIGKKAPDLIKLIQGIESVTESDTKRAEEKEEKEEDRKNLEGWSQLTKTFFYKIDGNDLVIGYAQCGSGEPYPVRRWQYSLIKELYEQLPEEATAKDLIEVSEDLAIDVAPEMATILLRFFDDYVDFDAELETAGNKLILRKRYSLWEARKEELRAESEMLKDLKD